MPLDEFKTQILLLHSEQSALDSLSSGFGDSYTVHCATTGSEALNTLVDTPINVLISAQDLPGMSGLEALREAKKRSPDTIGILLAGNDGDDLEALVGDKEVFQVVRGNITSDAILTIVDNATQQVRLTTLAESANDTAANVDEPQSEHVDSEHIVMETAENGSTIISDGTGRMRALNPAGSPSATSVGSNAVELLVLTKDQDFLATIKASSRGMHNVHYATTLAQATEAIGEHKIGVAIVDAAMIGERVEQLTQHLRKASARLVSIVAGRRDDGEMLMDLINRGKVYRFLLKPVSPGRARLAVEASVKHHLEAPDAAFKSKSAALTQSAPKQKSTAEDAARPEARPEPKPEAKPEPKPEPKPALKPQARPEPPPVPNAEKPVARESAPAAAPPPPAAEASIAETPISDGLTDAFGDSDSGFTETVAGLVSSVSHKFSGEKDADTSSPKANSSGPESRPAEADSGDSMQQKLKTLGIGSVALVAVVAAAFWFMSGPDDVATQEPAPPPAATVTDREVAVEAPTSDATVIDVDAPAAELQDDVQQTLSLVETALLESRLDDAAAALLHVRSVDPDNTRLPFLTAQLTQMQMRAYLANTRAAIRESRFEAASNAIAAARSLDVADDSEIDAVADELNTARSAQRAEDVLAMAEARLEDNDLLSPPDDSARYYYQLALSIDPDNTAASQGLRVVASKLALQARSETDDGNFESAQELLNEAHTLDPSNGELAAAVSALATARDAVAAQQKKDEAERLAAEERAATEQRAAEERAAAEQRVAEERAAAERREAEEQAAELVAQSDAAAPADGESTAEAVDTHSADSEPAQSDSGGDEASGKTPVVEKLEARADKPDTSFAAVSSLKRKKYVAPKYPRAAQRRNLSGWVDVVFTVGTDGMVKDVDIRNSEPGETFVNAATKAVEKWEFEPVIENGAAVEKRAGVRMMFALE